MSQCVVDALAGLALAEMQGLEVCLVIGAVRCERCQQTVLARVKRWNAQWPWVSTFRAVIIEVVIHEVLDGLDVGVAQLREVLVDVVVEVDFDICVLGLVGRAACGAVVPVPARRRDETFIICDFSVVDDCCTGRLDQVD